MPQRNSDLATWTVSRSGWLRGLVGALSRGRKDTGEGDPLAECPALLPPFFNQFLPSVPYYLSPEKRRSHRPHTRRPTKKERLDMTRRPSNFRSRHTEKTNPPRAATRLAGRLKKDGTRNTADVGHGTGRKELLHTRRRRCNTSLRVLRPWRSGGSK